MALTNEDLQAISQLMDKKLAPIKDDINILKKDVETLKDSTDTLKNDVTDIKQKVTRIDLTVEDEIRVNIQRVAEGHLDLSRKLNECIKLSSDIKDKQELQDIFLRMHNNKLKAL